jgi:hypothetical protein
LLFPFLKTPFEERDGQFSPDGKWIAYQSNETGRFEIYVQPFPGPGGRWEMLFTSDRPTIGAAAIEFEGGNLTSCPVDPIS